MKFSLLTVSLFPFAAAASRSVELPSSLRADSALGAKVMASARRLENAQGDDDAVADFTWVAGYSIKFQGCHHISQWNAEADAQEDVRIATKRLARFRLCPSEFCADESSGGCSSGYGDYVVDMGTYLQAYLENKQNVEEWTCQNLQENVCACDDDDAKDDGFDMDACLDECYAANGADYCIEGDDDAEVFDPAQYLECAAMDIANDDGGRRRAEAAEEEVQYFVGPYCYDQGSDILLGVFTDESCTLFADSGTYESMNNGASLPYASTSLVGMECVACKEPADANNDADQADEDEVTEMCEMMYANAGKCEKNFQNGNNNACNYMEGIKIVRSDGIISVAASGSSVAATFIGIFAASFFLLAGYSYYLKTKLDKINLPS